MCVHSTHVQPHNPRPKHSLASLYNPVVAFVVELPTTIPRVTLIDHSRRELMCRSDALYPLIDVPGVTHNSHSHSPGILVEN